MVGSVALLMPHVVVLLKISFQLSGTFGTVLYSSSLGNPRKISDMQVRSLRDMIKCQGPFISICIITMHGERRYLFFVLDHATYILTLS